MVLGDMEETFGRQRDRWVCCLHCDLGPVGRQELSQEMAEQKWHRGMCCGDGQSLHAGLPVSDLSLLGNAPHRHNLSEYKSVRPFLY